MNKKKRSIISIELKIVLGLLFISFITTTLWHFVDKKQEQPQIQNQVQEQQEQEQIVNIKSKYQPKQKIFLPKYKIIETENFTQKISVPFDLSEEELKENLLHAAQNLQKKTNAQKVIIYAYRPDDTEHTNFSAGQCILEDKKTPIFYLANVYHKYRNVYINGSKAVIAKDKTNLYKDRNINTNRIIRKLKKGTTITILESYRTFTMNYFNDIYKVKTANNQIGWVLDTNLTQVTYKNVITENNNLFIETIKRPITLETATVQNWENASEENKLAICKEFLMKQYMLNKLKYGITPHKNYYVNELKIAINAFIRETENIDKIKEQKISEISELLLIIGEWYKTTSLN